MTKIDYTELADRLFRSTLTLFKLKSQKHFNEVFHGETPALLCIANHEGDVLPSVIRQEMAVSSARVAATLNSLESKGLITRQIDTSDRRKILVRLTEDGKDIVEQRQQFIINEMAETLALLGEHDAKEHVRIINKLVMSLNEKDSCCRGSVGKEI